MINRQRFLLGVVEFLQKRGRCTKLDMIKIMFLITKERPPSFSMYGFYPYKLGPFSSQIYSDLTYFSTKGLVEETDKEFTVTREGCKEGLLPAGYEEYLSSLLSRYPTVEALIDHVYTKYPEYAMKSERRTVPVKIPLDSTPGFFVIGYEGRTIDDFIKELIMNNVQILVDVRNNPRSMKYEFNKERLAKSLQKVEIGYKHIPELGVISSKRKNLATKQDYERLFDEYASELKGKTKYIDDLIVMVKSRRIALMCFERDFQMCHRREIGKALKEKNQVVSII